MNMQCHQWTEAEQEAAYATYIGRSGCKKCKGIEVTRTLGKRITLTPYGVDNCQIDVPVAHIGKLIKMLRQAQKDNKADAERVEINTRLEYLRGEIRAERISYGELAELQGLAKHIKPDDVELLRAAGVTQFSRRRTASV